MSIVTLKPGLLVSLHTRMEGGVKYTRVDLNPEKTAAEGATVATWKTTKEVDDAAEFDRATKVRGKCGSLIRAACAHSAFGLLCPSTGEAALDGAIADARQLAETFNASTSSGIRVSVYALKGRIAETDGEAARALSSEMRELLDNMKSGIEAADVTAIREAASKAKKIGGMLDEATGRKVSAAIEEARSVAREIVKRLVDDADTVAPFIQSINLKATDEARFAFLDLDGPGEVVAVAADPRAVDLDTDEGGASMAASGFTGPELEV